MRNSIRFQKILTQSDWDELRAFAASFAHTIDDRTRTPMFSIRRGDRLFGYFSVAPFPVLFPAFHPDHTTPRDFVEAVEQIRGWQWLSTSGHERYPRGIVQFGLGQTNKETKEALQRLGCSRVADLWQSLG